jgi:DNA polymerase III epsilon subunit-like protein
MDNNIVFIDVEASGLHRTSYPIEVGWAFLDLSSDGFLIRPAADWSEWDWSVQSERIHGIRREECVRHGLDVWDATRRLNAEFAGKTLLSDAPGFDARWLAVLFDATGIKPEFELYLIDALQPIRAALADRGLDDRDLEGLDRRVRARFPRTHRAAADALYLAALYRAATEPDFLGDVGDVP